MSVTVRAAARDDAYDIARVRVETWRAAYAGLLPDAVLDGLDADAEGRRRHALWAEYTADPRNTQLVAEVDGEVVGFAATGPCRDDPPLPDGHLYAIYVLPSHWSTGAGHALLVAAEAALRSAGWTSAHLWVLDGNERAASFYERHGWREDGATQVDTSFVAAALHEHRRARQLDEPV